MTPMISHDCSIFTKAPKGLLTFILSGKEFCLDIRYVLTIISLGRNNSIEIKSSNKSEFIRYHDENFPLINIDSLNNKEESKRLSLHKYSILIIADNKKAAVYADQIVEFITPNEKILGSLKEVVFGESQGLIDKIEYERKTISIINLEKTL